MVPDHESMLVVDQAKDLNYFPLTKKDLICDQSTYDSLPSCITVLHNWKNARIDFMMEIGRGLNLSSSLSLGCGTSQSLFDQCLGDLHS
ncbi:hypothetical protein DsansV1_C15g0133861 [Dioscorea sansibarensis]